MATETIRFDDGDSYETYMGLWSHLAGAQFLDWLAPPPALRWLDVGCGNGAFTEMLLQRCAPATVHGIDPAPAQLDFARQRASAGQATFVLGDAQQLPFADDSFDAAVMALVIFFVPDPARGVAEMRRVVRPGGSVSAYAWDIVGGGFPYAALADALRAMGRTPTMPPQVDAARLERLHSLWIEAGLTAVQTHSITVQRGYADFSHFWQIALSGPSARANTKGLETAEHEELKARVYQILGQPQGAFRCSARAHAVQGRC